jgi:hypothetical protein
MVTFLPVGEDSARVAVDSTEKLYYAGDRVELFAGVFEGSRGIDNAQLTGVASLIDSEGMPKGPPMPVEFKFVGQGNYRAEFPTTVAGKYEVGLKVRGKYANGREFERGAGTSVEIRLRWAKIVSLTEQPVDEDGNGLIDRIEVTAQVQVDLAGEYSVQVDLFAAGANMQAYGKAKLEKGQGTITAIVGRYPLTHVAVDGPYKMSARLFRNGPDGEGFASLLENAGETRVYERSTFDRGPIYFPGTFSAAPKAAAGDGRMNQLVVSLDVFTPGGSCSWGGSLRNGRINIGNFYDRAELPKGPGKVDLVFDGIDISAAADGQPLQLGHFGITCGKVQAASEKDLDLPNFPAPRRREGSS